MIGTFRDGYLARFYRDDQHHKRLPAAITGSLYRRLQMLDAARSERDLRFPPGNHFEKLSGHLEDWRSLRVNQQWRLIFRWDETKGEALDIYLDNHSYR
jgi:proteic killer suppression protein